MMHWKSFSAKGIPPLYCNYKEGGYDDNVDDDKKESEFSMQKARLDRKMPLSGLEMEEVSTPFAKSQSSSDPNHFEGAGIPPTPLFLMHCRPEEPAAGAKRPHAAEGLEGERGETIALEATH